MTKQREPMRTNAATSADNETGKESASIRFVNPLTEIDGRGAGVSPASPMSLSLDSPTSPEGGIDVFLEKEPVYGFGRRRLVYFVFVVLSLAALLYASLMTVVFWYIFSVAAESITFVLLAQSTFLVSVLAWGIRVAHQSNEPGLNLYTFMLLMAVIMQVSMAMVVVVHGDELLLFFRSSAAAAQKQLCKDLAIDMNANENSTMARSSVESRLCLCDGEEVACVVTYIEQEYSIRLEQYRFVQLTAILLQLVLAKLGWDMMVDLDFEKERQLKEQAGGPPIATLRGCMVAGRDLLDTASKRGRDPKCVVELITPDAKAHRVQTAESQPLVDTLNPRWAEDFQQMVVYAGSRKLRISVVDMNKPKKPASMGQSVLGLDGNGRLERVGVEDLNGQDEIELDILHTEKIKRPKRGQPKEQAVKAGTVSLKLLYVPVGGSAEKAAKSVTSSWYFEATVLAMVGVLMCVLALQSPTDPPDDTLRGTLNMLEIFVATHMTFELALELLAQLLNGNLVAHVRSPWTVLALYVCMCAWISIFQPVQLVGNTSEQKWARIFSVSRVFRIFRPIRTLRMIRHVDLVLNILAASMNIMLIVCILLLFLLLLFSLIGMTCFSGAVQYTCMDTALARSAITGTKDMVVATDLPVGCTDECLLYIPHTLILKGILRNIEPLEADGAQISCPSSLLCALDASLVMPANVEIIRCMRLGSGECSETGYNNLTASEHEMAACEALANPHQVGMDEFGFQDFDNIVRAVVTMFVQTTGDGGMHAMPQALHASGIASKTTAWMIFFSASVLLNLLALNLFLAVCCSSYSEINSQMIEVESKLAAQQQKRIEALQLDETPEETEMREAQEAVAALTIEERVNALDWHDTTSKVAGFRNMCKQAILSRMFQTTISVIILVNTAVMALNYRGIDTDTADALNLVETIFLAIFVLEFVAKVLGLGWKLYFSGASNVFDFVVVCICLIGHAAIIFHDEIVEAFDAGGDTGDGIQALRAVRLLRALQITRLLHKNKALKVVLKTIFSAWKPICVHAIFCCFSVGMFAILGMHVLGGSLGCNLSLDDSPGGLCPKEELVAVATCPECRPAVADDYPYENYETFLKGVLVCFELTVGEEWSHVMYWYKAYAGSSSGSMETIVTAFFIIQYLWMNCVLFSLFIAMLLENFNLQETEKIPIQKKVWERRKRKAKKVWRAGSSSLLVTTLEGDKSKGLANTHDDSVKEMLVHAAAVADLNDNTNKSLYFFPLTHPLRLRCAAIQGHSLFQNGILALITISCVSLAIEGPANGYVRQNLGAIFEATNKVVLAAFVVEAVLKTIVHGFYYKSGPSQPYLQTRMNRIDFFIIVVCVVGYLPFAEDQLRGDWSKSLRVVRVLTPLVTLTKNSEISLVVVSFLRSIPDTAVIILPLFLMAVVFAVVGQEWFGGILGDCHTHCTVVTESLCVTADASKDVSSATESSLNDSATEGAVLSDLESCVEAGGTWIAQMFNFDNALNGVSLLFVALTDGVHEYMIDSTEAQGSGESILFWIAFHLVFTCFFLNLFIGVLAASFSKSKGTATQTIRQRQWHAVKHSIAAFHPVVHSSEGLRPVATATCCKTTVPHFWFQWRTLNFNLATNEKLEMFWRVVIMVNTFTLATDEFPASQMKHDMVAYLNLTCLSLCTFEVIIKLTGYGFNSYFSNGWLVSDFCLVTISWALRVGKLRTGVESLRVVRVFRLIALASKMPTLVALVQSLISCLRASMALIAISCVIIYVYSIIGVNLFGNIDVDPDNESLNDYDNFADFLSAASLLVQVVFGQEIGGFVEDLTNMGVSFTVVFLYFGTYYMVMVWVCVNLLLVSVLDTFAVETANTDTEGVRLDDFEGFAHCWAALTVGAHVVPFAQKNMSVFEKIADKVAHPLDTLDDLMQQEDEDGDNADEKEQAWTPEDGKSHYQGNLRITIENATGLEDDTIRPYCKVKLHGPDRQEAWTSDAITTAGKAVFEEGPGGPLSTPDPVTKVIGHTLSMHINEQHDALSIEVHDNCQFVADFIAAVRISRKELQQSDKPVTKLLLLQRSSTAKPMSPRASSSGTDHWARFETDAVYIPDTVDETEALDAESIETPSSHKPHNQAGLRNPLPLNAAQAGIDAIPDENANVEDERVAIEESKLGKTAKKRKKQQEKKRVKEEKKAEKARQKLLRRDAKQREKAGLVDRDITDDKDGTAPAPPPSNSVVTQEWVDSGVTLQVTFAFERLKLCTPKMGFLGEYEVTYSHKEANCGVEGWLHCSVDGGPFMRRFVYIQDFGNSAENGHSGCVKIVTSATDGNQLEHQASADALEIQTIPAYSIMNIYAGSHECNESEDSHHHGTKHGAHIGCEFQIGCNENNRDHITEETVGHISGQIVCAENLINVARGTGETSDPYCVLTLISSGSLAAAHGDGRRHARTQPINDNLNPVWNHEFGFDAMVTTTTLLVEVYDKRVAHDLLIGSAELQMRLDGSGPVWTSGAKFPGSSSESIDIVGSERTTVRIRLMPRGDNINLQRDLSADVDERLLGTGAGIVTLDMKYMSTSSQHDVNHLVQIARDIDAKYNKLKKSKQNERAKMSELVESKLAVKAQKRADYLFRALSPNNQMAWVSAFRWLTRGCPEVTRPKPIPHAKLVHAEFVRASHNIDQLDLPMARLTRLINGIHRRQVLGGHMPTRRWTTYVIFNIEMHCMAASKRALKKKETRRRNETGIYLADIRGLSFHRTLERIALLHLGKRKCLSYEEQASEYEIEVNAISLQVIQSVLQWWVNRRRKGLTQGGESFPRLAVWSKNEALYLRASDAVCVARLRSLRVLFGEVKKRIPNGYDTEGGVDPENTKIAESTGKPGFLQKRRMKKLEADKARKRQEHVGSAMVDGLQVNVQRITDVFNELDADGNGELDEQEMRSAIVTLMGEIHHKVEEEMMKMVDADGSGTVGLDEFIEGMTTIAAACPDTDSDEDEDDSELDDLDTDAVDLQRRLGSA